MSELLQKLAPAIDEFVTRVADAAEATDREGRFPTDLAAAFLASGLGGLISASTARIFADCRSGA